MTLVFQLFASHAGRQEKSGRKFLPARARVNLQKSLSPVSPCHPEAGAYEVKVSYLRYKSQLLAMRKSVTYDTKVSYLRSKSQLLTMRKSVTCDAKFSYLRCKSQLLTIRKSVTYDAKDSYLRKWFKYGLKAQKLLGAFALSRRVGQNLRKFRCESQRLMPHNLLACEANHKC